MQPNFSEAVATYAGKSKALISVSQTTYGSDTIRADKLPGHLDKAVAFSAKPCAVKVCKHGLTAGGKSRGFFLCSSKIGVQKEATLQEVLDDAKRTFRRLVAEHANSESIIELLVSLRAKVSLSVDDTGWALWNICDRYALMRDAKSQHKYQSEFHEWGKTNLSPLRLHWVVSDATQALTLIDGGFLDFWWKCYEFANAQCPLVAENRTVRFESHRANAYAYTRFREFSRAEAALNAMEKLLAEDRAWGNREFAAVTFRTLLVDFYNAKGQADKVANTGEALQGQLDDWLRRAGDAEGATPGRPLPGSWAQLNADRPPTAVFIAVHNAACAFTKAKQFPVAERLFRVLLEKRRTVTAYGEANYLLSCWENRGNKDEIVDWLDASKRLTPKKLKRFAPELIDVVKDERPDFA